MKKQLIALALLGAATTVSAMEIESYTTRVDIGDDRAAKAEAVVALIDAAPGKLYLPIGLGSADALRLLDAPLGSEIARADVGGNLVATLTLPRETQGNVTVRFAFDTVSPLVTPVVKEGNKPSVPKGTRILSHTFTNTQPHMIGHYRLEAMLPQGAMVQEIAEQTPKVKKTDVLPRVRLEGVEGRQGAVLQLTGMKLGDRTSMKLEVVSEAKSSGWLLAGLALSVAYLIGFSSLVSKRKERA